MKIVSILLISIFTTIFLLGQGEFKPDGSKKAARGYFKYQNFRFSLKEYEELLKKDSFNIEYRYKVAQCYLYTNIDKNKAINHLEWVVKQPKADPNAWYDLGRAYQLSYRFDDAKRAFQKFISLTDKDNNYIPAKKQIEQCDHAKKLMEKPLQIQFELLPTPINSPSPDYNPYISADENLLVFTSKRQGNIGNFMDYDGFLTPDIYISRKENNIWKKAKNAGPPVNTYLNEEISGLTPDGKVAFFFYANEQGNADIFISEISNLSFKRPVSAGSYVNTDNFENGATFTPDGKKLIFASSMPGGLGGMDLYMSYLLPNGEWGEPINLGPNINTSLDEDYPYFAPDGKTFIFSSNGHPGMGGYDLFKCTYDPEKNIFSKPVNLGYPVNTPDDEFTISFTRSMRYAYMSLFRPNGIGDLDIYRLIFSNVPPPATLIHGYVLTSDSTPYFQKLHAMKEQYHQYKTLWDSIVKTYPSKTKLSDIEQYHPDVAETKKMLEEQLKNMPQEMIIKLYDLKNNNLYGQYKPSKTTSKFIIIAAPGEYKIELNLPPYQPIEKKIIIPEGENSDVPQKINLVLTQ
ncbi:MAG: hypothetical protein N2Z72_07720 [Bacteroidales bacterium]|nr:hypothetical protein [Bacteroidales bacterium]